MSRSPTITEERAVLNLPPTHPGEILAEELAALGVSANALARALDVPPNRVTEILNGRRAVTADTALRLARYFATSAKFWMNLQQSYELAVAERDHGAAIARTVRPRPA
jgi:addiction module HigA family antidote